MSYTLRNLDEIEDMAAKHGFGHVGEARFAAPALETEQTGLSSHKLRPNARQAFGHSHESTEEVYVVISGSGRVKLDGDVVELRELDAVRIPPPVIRALEAGEVHPDWWTD